MLIAMAKLSQRATTDICRTYRKHCGLTARLISVNGQLAPGMKKPEMLFFLKSAAQMNAFCLQEAVHWGEPYIFSWAPQVVSWVIPMIDDRTIRGGILSGPVISAKGSSGVTSADAQAAIHEESVRGLAERGMRAEAAGKYIKALPRRTTSQIRGAALFLQETFYQVSGWKPLLLEENRLKALQQRQISYAIEEQKKSGQTAYPVDKERMLLSLIKVGDQNGAKRLLNEMLAAMFLFSPRLPLLRARAIEMMGYLTRAAVEDCHLMEPLIERNHQWMQQLIKSSDFETLSHVLMQALDDFMEGIYAQGFNCYNPKASRALDYISRHYTTNISLDDLAREMGLSKFRVSHLVKAHTGRSVLQHVMRLRIQKAQQLLARTSMPCAQVAAETGFCDQSYFIKQFKRIAGVAPAKYRRAKFSAQDAGHG